MQTVNYYTGSQVIEPNADTSDEFMVNARDMYTYNQQPSYQNQMYYPQQQYTGARTIGEQFMMNQQNNQNPNPFGNLHYNNGLGTNMSYQIQNPVVQAPNQGQIMYPQSPQMQFGAQSAQLQLQMHQNAPNPNFGYRDGGPGIVTYRNPGYIGNPAFSYIQQQQGYGYQQPLNYGTPQPQQQVVHVSGANPLQNGKYLFSSDTQEKLDQMQVDMMLENQEALAKKEMQASRMSSTYLNNNYGGGFYYNPQLYGGIDPQVYNKYKTKVQEMASEAEARRTSFNKKLSKLCHSWLGDEVTDEQINKVYDGYTYTVPQQDIMFANAQQRFDRLVPVNTAPVYWAHDAAVTAEFRKYCPDGRNMNEFLNDATIVRIKDAEEQEKHRRQDGKQFYDQDVMHHYIRKYAKEKMIDDSGIDYSKASKGEIMRHLMGKDNLKDLADSGITIRDDGHFDFKINWESAPQSLKDKLRDPSPVSSIPSGELHNVPTVKNQNAIIYEENRSKFFQSIMATNEGLNTHINYDDGTGTGNIRNISPPIAMGGG